MMSMRRHRQPLISTRECREMMKKEFCQIVNEDIINGDQGVLIENYSKALQNDFKKQTTIKEKLNSNFFNIQKQRKNSKNQLRKQFSLSQNKDTAIRDKLKKQWKQSLNLNKSSRIHMVKTPESRRYNYETVDSFMVNRRQCNKSSLDGEYHQTISKNMLPFSLKIDQIIQQSNKIKDRQTIKSRNIMTSSERQNKLVRRDKIQKEKIIDKIIVNDVDEYLKSYSVQINNPNPQSKRNFYEERRKKQLKNFDKYNMSFTSYMKQKTIQNIEKTIYNDKIRQKDSYVQKFQKFILDQFKFSEQAHRRLQKVFKGIELQFKRPIRNRQISERLSPK